MKQGSIFDVVISIEESLGKYCRFSISTPNLFWRQYINGKYKIFYKDKLLSKTPLKDCRNVIIDELEDLITSIARTMFQMSEAASDLRIKMLVRVINKLKGEVGK